MKEKLLALYVSILLGIVISTGVILISKNSSTALIIKDDPKIKLHSILYVEEGDTLALDYLNDKELKILKNHLK